MRNLKIKKFICLLTKKISVAAAVAVMFIVVVTYLAGILNIAEKDLCFLKFLKYMEVKAAGFDYTQEDLHFDDEGNLVMTTYDIKATKSTRYCTLGWTIKKYDLPVDDPQNVCAVIVITSITNFDDPENDRYMYSYFLCDRESIFNAIGAASAEWQRELYMNGATVYLDGIMSVAVNDRVLGSLNSDGSRSGEVYDTYEGIVSARNWGSNSKKSLLTHFNKSLYFPAIQGLFEEEGQEDGDESIERGSITLGFDRWGAEFDESVSISAHEYIPAAAIPSGEQIEIDAWQLAYAYQVKYKKITGKTACKVPVEIYRIKQAEEGEESSFSLTPKPSGGQDYILLSEMTYSYMMPYSYYEIESVKLYYADGIIADCGAFAGGCFLDTVFIPDIDIILRTGVDEHVLCEPADETVKVYISSDMDAETIDECIKSAVSVVANIPYVRNDYLSINGDEIMTDEWSFGTGKAPVQNIRYTYAISSYSILTLPIMRANGSYTVNATAYYGCETYGTASGRDVSRNISGINNINIHTPVVCTGDVSDVREWNQAEYPSEENPTIVLDKAFTVKVSNQGEHINEKGYKVRDYEKYVLYNQVKFPFDVIDNGELVKAHTWITLKNEKDFVLPAAFVIEGRYEIEYRAMAYNYNAGYADFENTENYANLSRENYIAVNSSEVEVVGQLYDFALTEIIDYKTVCDLKKLTGAVCNVPKLPFIWREEYFKGLNTYLGLPLGSYFRFMLRSIGSYGEGASVTIIPSFFYVAGDMQTETEVDIYYEDVAFDGSAVLKKWNTEDHKIELTKNTVEEISLEIVSESGSIGGNRCQLWQGIYMLPMKSYCLPKGETLPLHGIDKSNFLDGGYILIRFDITVKDKDGKNMLSYINAKNAPFGYCNRWQKEGGINGEVIIYNTDKNVRDKMTISGTH